MMDMDEIQTLLNRNQVHFEILQNKKPIFSVQDAEEYYDISQTAPILIIITERGYFAVIKAGSSAPIDFKVIKQVLRCHKVRMASRHEVLEITGYEAGQVPLVGHELPVILDSQLFQHPFVYGGIGDASFTLKIDPIDIEKVNQVVAKLSLGTLRDDTCYRPNCRKP